MSYGQPDYSDYETGDDDTPSRAVLIGAIAGAAVLTIALSALLLATRMLPRDPLMQAAALVTLGGAMWLALFAVLLRRAALGWTIAALAILGPSALAVGLWRIGHDNRLMREDGRAALTIARAFAKQSQILTRAKADLPMAAGPMSEIVKVLMEGQLDDQRAYQGKVDDSGLDTMATPALALAKGSVIEDCGRIDALKEAVEMFHKSQNDRVATARKAALDSGMPDRFLVDFVGGLDQDTAAMRSRLDEQLALEVSIIENNAKACRILARRRWVEQGGTFAFTDMGDLNSIQALKTSLSADVARSLRLQAEAASRMNAKLDRARESFR